jgi:hypothetical protein
MDGWEEDREEADDDEQFTWWVACSEVGYLATHGKPNRIGVP